MYTKGFLQSLATTLHSSLVQRFNKKRCADACSSSFFSFKKYTVFSNKSLFKY